MHVALINASRVTRLMGNDWEVGLEIGWLLIDNDNHSHSIRNKIYFKIEIHRI